jgi:hypothetical protein
MFTAEVLTVGGSGALTFFFFSFSFYTFNFYPNRSENAQSLREKNE